MGDTRGARYGIKALEERPSKEVDEELCSIIKNVGEQFATARQRKRLIEEKAAAQAAGTHT